MVHIYNGILLSHREEQNNAICSHMGGTRDDHTKCNKSDRERQIPCDITYVKSKKMTQMDLSMKQTDSQT